MAIALTVECPFRRFPEHEDEEEDQEEEERQTRFDFDSVEMISG